MSSSSSFPVKQSLAIGAALLASVGAGVSMLTTPSTAPPAPAVSAQAASAPSAPVVKLADPAPVSKPAPRAVPLDVTALTQTGLEKQPDPLRFPFVSGNDARVDSRITARINNLLFIETFEILAPVNANDGLHEVSADTWQSLASIDFEVGRNDGHVLSIWLNSENCGSYCEAHTSTYAFDATSGRHLGLEDLFSAAGLEALNKDLKSANLAAIEAAIGRLKASLKASKGKKTSDNQPGLSREELTAAIGMYNDCIKQRKSPDYDKFQQLGMPQIQAQTVVFSVERCSNHAMQALDEVGNFSLGFSPEQLKPWLSAYGRDMLLGEASGAVAPTSPWGQVWRGAIDVKLPVTLYLGAANSLYAPTDRYFYDDYRKPIALTRSINNATITLTEAESKETPPPRLVLSQQDGGLRGSWEGKRTLDVVLNP